MNPNEVEFDTRAKAHTHDHVRAAYATRHSRAGAGTHPARPPTARGGRIFFRKRNRAEPMPPDDSPAWVAEVDRVSVTSP